MHSVSTGGPQCGEIFAFVGCDLHVGGLLEKKQQAEREEYVYMYIYRYLYISIYVYIYGYEHHKQGGGRSRGGRMELSKEDEQEE